MATPRNVTEPPSPELQLFREPLAAFASTQRSRLTERARRLQELMQELDAAPFTIQCEGRCKRPVTRFSTYFSYEYSTEKMFWCPTCKSSLADPTRIRHFELVSDYLQWARDRSIPERSVQIGLRNILVGKGFTSTRLTEQTVQRFFASIRA